jgi:hypothetical protein
LLEKNSAGHLCEQISSPLLSRKKRENRTKHSSPVGGPEERPKKKRWPKPYTYVSPQKIPYKKDRGRQNSQAGGAQNKDRRGRILQPTHTVKRQQQRSGRSFD